MSDYEKALKRIAELEAILREIVEADEAAILELQSMGMPIDGAPRELTEKAKKVLLQ